MKCKKNKVLIGGLIWLSWIMPITAQIDLSVASIPDSLKKNAYSVIRFDHETIDISSIKSGVRKKSYGVTVLDEKGENNANFKFNGDVFQVLKSFSAKLYDAQGKLLKKFNQSDLVTSEYSSDLASDTKMYMFECNVPSLPFTIQYDFEVALNKGILMYGIFMPVGSYFESVQNYIYEVRLPENLKPRIKSFNNMSEPSISSLKGVTSYVWKIENLKAVESEPLSPPLDDYIPYVIIASSNFVYDGVPGSVNTWSDLGKWTYNLTVGRDVLTETINAKLLNLIKNAKTDREKVQILYDFLGEKTRYVSIQLGIGGYQPMSAMEVNKTGFGDCKALTNYLKAMLSFIGINSYYCTIRSDDSQKDLLPDFPNFTEMNHVILMVPLQNEKLWIECTNPRIPFGFIHNRIAGHEVLVCKAEGGEIQRLPDYPDTLNVEQHVANVALLADGSASVKMYKECKIKIYDQYEWFPLAKATDQSENLREDIHLPNVTLGSFKITENKTALPFIKVDYSWSTSLYGSKTGNRLFLPVNIFRSGYDQLRKSNRIHDIYISTGFRDVDSIVIQIPETFEVEALPPAITENGRYGRFTSSVTQVGQQLQIVQVADVSSGKFKVSEFPQFMAFLNKISAAYKSKIILRKKAV